MLQVLIFIAAQLCWQCQFCEQVRCNGGGAPTPIPPECASPLSFLDGRDGTVWKPEGDHTGELVVILAEQHDYERCEAKRPDGSWENLRYTGRANGNRQHWRGAQPGKFYANKNKGGGVRCDGECFFPIPGPTKKRWE